MQTTKVPTTDHACTSALGMYMSLTNANGVKIRYTSTSRRMSCAQLYGGLLFIITLRSVALWKASRVGAVGLNIANTGKRNKGGKGGKRDGDDDNDNDSDKRQTTL